MVKNVENKKNFKSHRQNFTRKVEYETPYISDLHKEFLKTTLLDRKELLLEKAISQNTNMPKLTHKPKGPKR